MGKTDAESVRRTLEGRIAARWWPLHDKLCRRIPFKPLCKAAGERAAEGSGWCLSPCKLFCQLPSSLLSHLQCSPLSPHSFGSLPLHTLTWGGWRMGGEGMKACAMAREVFFVVASRNGFWPSPRLSHCQPLGVTRLLTRHHQHWIVQRHPRGGTGASAAVFVGVREIVAKLNLSQPSTFPSDTLSSCMAIPSRHHIGTDRH